MEGDQRIVIADRSVFIRALLGRLCENAGHSVVGEASTVAALVGLVDETAPDVVITDVDLADGPIESVLTQIRQAGPRIVVVSADAVPGRLSAILVDGVSGYLLHDTPPVQIIDALHIVTRGAAALDPVVAGAVLREWRSLRAGGPRSAAYTTE
jgi:DNA-binding NarL/FixJ family response regulator